MSSQTLSDFYTTASQRGFSRDFQIRVDTIQIANAAIPEDYLNYIKSVSLPSRKVAIDTISYNTVKIPVSTGISDFGEKDNYQITFWADQALDFRDWFYDKAEPTYYPANPSGPSFPGALTDSIIQLSVLDDSLQPVYGCQLEGVIIKEISNIKYNKEGTGKPQEFTVTFAYYRLSPYSGKVTDTGIVGGIQQLTQGINAITGTINAVRGVAQAGRSAVKAIRGR